METDDAPVSAVEFLARSETRVRALETLAREGELSRGDLRERLDATRTTVQRNLDALAERGWVTETDRTYAVTRTGEWIAEDFGDLVETVRQARRLRPVIERVDPDDLDVDLRDADVAVTTSEPGNPWKPVDEHVETIRDAREHRALLPLTGSGPFEAIHERTGDGAREFEAVVAPAVAETFRSDPAYREHYADLRERSNVRFLVTERSIPYYLGVADGTVEIGVDDGGQPAALLRTESPAVLEWAEQTYETYRADAVPIGEY